MTAKEGKKETKLDFSLFALLLFLLVGNFSIFVLSPDGKGKKKFLAKTPSTFPYCRVVYASLEFLSFFLRNTHLARFSRYLPACLKIKFESIGLRRKGKRRIAFRSFSFFSTDFLFPDSIFFAISNLGGDHATRGGKTKKGKTQTHFRSLLSPTYDDAAFLIKEGKRKERMEKQKN